MAKKVSKQKNSNPWIVQFPHPGAKRTPLGCIGQNQHQITVPFGVGKTCLYNCCRQIYKNGPTSPRKLALKHKYTVALMLREFLSANEAVSHIQYLLSLGYLGDYICGAKNNPQVYLNQVNPKRDTHQRRLKTKAIYDFLNGLIRIDPQLRAMKTFDDVWLEVRKVASQIHGIGDVTTYDFTLRYCINELRICPDHVYLHSANGPLKGARKFFNATGKQNIIDINGNTINVNKLKSGCRIPICNFKPELYPLCARSIEHILCIYHNKI